MTHYIPLGKNCAPALVLRESGLRKESLPFDWVLGEPEHIKRSLDLNFSDWFEGFKIVANITELEDYLNDDTNVKRLTIHPNYPISHNVSAIGAFFAHMDFSDQTVVDSMKKRISRFNDILASDEDIVIVSSMEKDRFFDAGLLEHFGNKPVYVIFIKYIHSSNRKMIVNRHGDHYLISYYSPNEFDPDSITEISNTLKALSSPQK